MTAIYLFKWIEMGLPDRFNSLSTLTNGQIDCYTAINDLNLTDFYNGFILIGLSVNLYQCEGNWIGID